MYKYIHIHSCGKISRMIMLITLSEKIKMLKITVTMHVCFHLPKKNLAEYILNH